jgi:ribosomal-protein-alanine N-acetyltransferase
MDDIFSVFPTILLDKIVLRKIIIEDDYLDFFNYINNPQVAEYLSSYDLPATPELAKIELGYWASLFEKSIGFYWAITIDNKIIGTCGFNYWNRDQRRAEVSYDLDFNHWNKGITSQAIKAITDFALKEMQVQRIQATVAIDNIGSIRVLEKSGFIQEGLLKKYGILNGETRDFYMYARTS